MPMTTQDRSVRLQRWIDPPGTAEQQRLERALRMVTQAIRQHPPFHGLDLAVEPKGSWANNTNVRSDSDVDIKVEFTQRVYRGGAHGMTFWEQKFLDMAYKGIWTPKAFRAEVARALKGVSDHVDDAHNVAFYVPDVPGSRPSTDVVPCYTYIHERGWGRGPVQGTVVFTQDGKHIINWSHQQLVNGREKNKRTGRRYKFAVRALKAVENDLAAAGIIGPLASYFMECLVYNVPDDVLMTGSLDEAFRATLAYLRHEVRFFWGNPSAMVEPNEMKKVFQEGQKWKTEDASRLLNAAWDHLNYG
jgi:hypothetical protein